MRAIALAALASLSLGAENASASGNIECRSLDDTIRLSLAIGSLPVLKIVGGVLTMDDRDRMIGGTEEGSLAVGQAFRGEGTIMADFTDPNVEAITARLRLSEAGEGTDFITAGTLALTDIGVYAVQCVGP